MSAPSHDNDAATRLRRLDFLDRLGQSTRSITDATELMAATARMLGEHLGATRCAYADVEADGDRFTIRADWSRPGVPSSAGVYSLALFGSKAVANLNRGQDLVLRDVDRELAADDGAAMFSAIGIKALVCAGLVKNKRLVAMMAVHQDAPRDWTADDIALIDEVVDRCWAHIERVRALALLQEQDRNKDVFLATLAHELRNPLAPLRYAATLLEGADKGGSHAKAREVIGRQVSLMARLIDDLLDLSRVSRGLVQLQRTPCEVQPLLERALELARPQIDAARHSLQVTGVPAGTVIDADPARIVQVVSNLLSNAAKYTPEGGLIRLTAQVQDGQVRIDVADNGIGIPPQDQQRVFEMFTQLEHTRTRAQGGLGIGLALARSLVELHGGTIRASSPGLGHGSTFSLELPLAAAQPAPAAGARSKGSAGQQARVLVVEDLPDSREALVMLLESMGHAVDSAADGHEAVAKAPVFDPEVVLLDLGLPGIDGIEVARRLRGMPALSGTRIYALTGWGTDADRARTREAGFDGHFVKPVAIHTLEELLRSGS
jgi:signal transduction histidine kinase/CheY-like chemotaxis protein